MYYLDEKQFLPLLICISFFIVPIIIALWVVLFFEFELVILLVSLVFLVAYIILILILRKTTKTKVNYLIIHDEMLEIHYPNIGNGAHLLNVNFCDVIEIEYYRITSIRGWCQILAYVAPKCAYITYLNNGRKVTELMGFFDLKDILKITSEKDIKLKIR